MLNKTKPMILALKENEKKEHFWKISLNQVFIVVFKSNTSKTEKLKRLI